VSKNTGNFATRRDSGGRGNGLNACAGGTIPTGGRKSQTPKSDLAETQKKLREKKGPKGGQNKVA